MSSPSFDRSCVANATPSRIEDRSPARRRARLRLTASVLALTLAALTAPAFAQQTGGNGGGSGGAGGQTDPTDGTGSAGAIGSGGGGGGGAGIVGGDGGGPGGGAGGVGPGDAGFAAAANTGSGGGGGAHGSTTLPLGSPVYGGNGGGGSLGTSGGGGGGGGYGVFITGTGFAGSVTHAVTGGNGGGGGSGNSGGSGGVGGVGVFFAGSASLTNLSTIQGGNGGGGGSGAISSGSAGAGGAGVVGAGLIIDNTGGTISGGSGNGGRANAIRFTGGSNVLTLAGSGGLTGNIALDNASIVTFDQATDVTLANIITGNGGVIQNAAGKLILTGASTYTGGTTITSGTLQIGDGGTTGSIAGNVLNNATLAFNRSNDLTFGGAISGTGTLTKDAAGTLTLTGGNSYAGTTTVSAGVLNIQNASALGSTAAGTTVVSGAALQIQGGISIGAEALTLNGTGVNNDGALRNMSGGSSYGGAITLGSASRINADAGSLSLDSTITGTNSGLTLGGGGNITGYGAISLGTGGLTKDGSGTVELRSVNVYSGATTINDGTLWVRNGSAIDDRSAVTVNAPGILRIGFAETIGSLAGSGRVDLVASLTTGGDNGSTAFSGTIFSGGGGYTLTKTGTGTFTLTGASTYDGTIISGGTLQIGDGGTTGSIAGYVANNATLAFDRSDDVTFAGVISGSGAVNQAGTGKTVLTSANTYSGGTTISAGTLQIGNGGTTGSIAGNVVNDGALVFNRSNSTAYAGVISGSGSLTKLGSDSLYLTGDNTFSGTTTVSAGTLYIGNGGTVGSITGNVVNNDGLGFFRSNGLTYGGIISGSGRTAMGGGGTVTLTGANTYTGGTLITGTMLEIGNGGITGSIVGDVVTDFGGILGGLVFNRSDDLAFAGVISGTGMLIKQGAGVLTLTGASTLTGDTTVSAGNLRVNGSLASAVTVETGATLSGTGTISNAVTVQNGGTLSAGQSPGTLTVGSLTLASGAYSAFELGAAGTVGGIANDLVNVTGNLALGGALTVDAASAGYYRLFNYGTLTAGSAFNAVSTSPHGTVRVLTNIAGQVNLSILRAGQQMQFWDGADATGNGTVNGGTGTWSAANTNWTGAPGEAGINDQWRGSVGVFAGAAGGTVTVEGTQAFDTLQFSTDGYVLAAGANGQLQLAGASNIGTINVDGGVTATINNQIVDGTATGLSKVGTGTLILAGPNAYTGTTTVSAGVLNIQHASALGTADGATVVASGAALQMQGGITVTDEALTLNGTGVNNDGALRSVGATNQYFGVITLGSASLITADVTGSLNLQGITGTNTNLAFGGAGAVAVNGDITTGTGSLTKDGTGFVHLFGNNTYTGVTTINAGSLSVASGHAIADTGVVVVNASGQFTVGSSETISSLAGAGNVEIRGFEKLTTGGNNISTTFSGVISETSYPDAKLAKIGTGTFTLSGINTYTGATTVDGGTLSVNGSIATSSMTTVNAGGLLSGTGFVGNTTINGGTLAPGNSIGTLTVQGNLSFTAASTYLVEVSPNNVDRVNVTGTATLGGATVNASFAPGSYVEKQYTILNAQGGVSGKFGGPVNSNLPTNFKSALSTDANNAYLNLTLDFTPTPNPTPGGNTPSFGSLPGNQGSVASALEGFFNRTGGIPLVFGALDAKGLSQLSGELAPGSQQTSFDVMNLFMMQMTDPFAAGRGEAAPGAMPYAGDAMAYAAPKRAPTDAFASMHRKAPPMVAPQERWNVWAAGFGGSQTTDGNAAAGTNNSKSSIYGMAVGADYWFSPFTVAGLSMAGGGTNFSVNGGGSGRSDLFQVGGFVRHMMGSVYVSAAAAYGWQDVTTDRVVTVAGFDQLRANFNANSYSGRVELGNRFVLPWVGGLGLTPYGAVQVTAFDLPSYAESVVAGANTFALAYSGKTITATRSELGVRTDKSFALNDAILTLRGRAAWAHDFDTDRSASATFQSLPGASFVVNGAALARNAALTTASAELKWMNGWSVAGTFEGEFSDVTKSYAGKGVVRYAW